MHSALAITGVFRYDASCQRQALNYAQLQATLSSLSCTGYNFY